MVLRGWSSLTLAQFLAHLSDRSLRGKVLGVLLGYEAFDELFSLYRSWFGKPVICIVVKCTSPFAGFLLGPEV